MPVTNPVKATERVESKIDPLSILIVVIAGGLWESIVADSLLFGWNGGPLADIFAGSFIVFSIKSLTGFYLAFLLIKYVKLEWGDEPSSDFRVVLCHFIVRRWQRGSKGKIWLSIYHGLSDSLRQEGVLPPCTKELYLP